MKDATDEVATKDTSAAKKDHEKWRWSSLQRNLFFKAANLNFRAPYVLIHVESSCRLNLIYIHPGDYNVKCSYDENRATNFSSGDYINGSFDTPATAWGEQARTKSVMIDFLIPYVCF
jgi:hypothetical protein